MKVKQRHVIVCCLKGCGRNFNLLIYGILATVDILCQLMNKGICMPLQKNVIQVDARVAFRALHVLNYIQNIK